VVACPRPDLLRRHFHLRPGNDRKQSGLAVALAIRPTLENLIGGIMLYLDQPVRIGDFCSFGDKTGTVENIGVRTTKIRALDRTLISIK
jgi:MscS family membrane protein